jgi:hypothetical protein
VTTVSLTLRGDPEDVDRQARQLRAELLDLDVDSAEFAPGGPPPAASKGLDPATVTEIIVALSSSPVLIQLGRALRDWVKRGTERKIEIQVGEDRLTITGSSAEVDRAVIEAFFRREPQD